MKIAHMADIHLGYRQFNKTIQVEDITLNQREYDVFQSFKTAMNQCRSCDAILIAGDMFHSINPSNWTVENTIKLLNDIDVPIYIIGGNHDTPLSSETRHILALIEETTDVVVAYKTPKRVMISNNGGQYSLQMEPIRPTGMDIKIPSADILLIHGVHPTFDRNSNSPWYVPSGAYNNKDYKYIAWGDSHDFQRMAPHEYYAGSLDYVSTSAMQEHEMKGYVILDTLDWSAQHVALEVRPHVLVETDDFSEAEKQVEIADDGFVMKIKSTNPAIFQLKEHRSKFLNLSFDIRVEEKEAQKLATWTEFSRPYGEAVTKLGIEYMRE